MIQRYKVKTSFLMKIPVFGAGWELGRECVERKKEGRREGSRARKRCYREDKGLGPSELEL